MEQYCVQQHNKDMKIGGRGLGVGEGVLGMISNGEQPSWLADPLESRELLTSLEWKSESSTAGIAPGFFS